MSNVKLRTTKLSLGNLEGIFDWTSDLDKYSDHKCS